MKTGSILRFTLLLCFFVIASVGQSWADKRVALVIGNSGYRNVPRLPNPNNDASAVALLFKNAGFDIVETHLDLGIGEMRRAVRDFSEVVRGTDIAVMFYAGHGIEFGGSNYLIPIDAALESDFDVPDEAISLDRILTVLEPAKRLRLVILDACRDNLFSRTMKRTMARRSISRGLVEIEPTISDTLIAFAAKAGSTAADGEGDHSPFTAALLKNIGLPGLDVRLALGRVRDEVLKATRGQQEPFVYGSLGGGTVALVSAPTIDPTSAEAIASGQLSRDYELTAQIGTQESWRAFLTKYPTGFYAELARAQLTRLAGVEIRGRLARFIEFEHLGETSVDHYAPQVDYYDQGLVSREVVLQDISTYKRRWPIQTYSLTPGTLDITVLGSNRYAATFSLTFAHSNGPKKISGESRKQLILDYENGQFYISYVREIAQRQ